MSKQLKAVGPEAAAEELPPAPVPIGSAGCFACFGRGGTVEADVVVVGGGFAGAFAAYQLGKQRPELRVVLVEREATVGGRLYSDDNDPENTTNKDELGGMRIFPSVQPEVAALIEELDLHMSPIGLRDHTNWFYHHGKGIRARKAEHLINGKSPGELIAACSAAFREALPEEADMDPMDSPELRSLSLTQFLLKYGCTQEEVDEWFMFSGYDIFTHGDVQASIFFHEGELYGSNLDDDQRYVREGYQESVRRMVARSGATLFSEASVESVERAPRGRHYVYFRTSTHRALRRINTRFVICALAKNQIVKLSPRIHGLGAQRRRLLRNSVRTVPLFKCFLEWERVPDEPHQWWEKHGFLCGKSTTDLHVRQIHYYDHEDILLYQSGSYATYWDREFSKDARAAAQKMFDQIKQVHGMEDLPEPDWSSTIFKYWSNGSHKWRVGVNVPKAVQLIADGTLDKSNVFLCGDAFSTHQGWTSGCLETANIALARIMSQTAPKQAAAEPIKQAPRQAAAADQAKPVAPKQA